MTTNSFGFICRTDGCRRCLVAQPGGLTLSFALHLLDSIMRSGANKQAISNYEAELKDVRTVACNFAEC